MKSGKLKGVCQWAFGSMFMLASLGAFTSGDIICGILVMALGIYISPLRKKVFEHLPDKYKTRSISIAAGVFLAVAGFVSIVAASPEEVSAEAGEEVSIEASEEFSAVESAQELARALPAMEETESASEASSEDTAALENSKEEAEKEEAVAAATEEKSEVKEEKAEPKVEENVPAEAPSEAPTIEADNSNQTAGGAGNADNFNTYDIPEQQQTSETYVLNTNTQKFHRPSCNEVKKIAPENYATSSESRDSIIAQKYKACKKCNP